MSLLAATAVGRMTEEVRPHEVQPAKPDVSDKPKRGWFSFSIRDLMWFTILAALAVAWFVEQRRAADLSVERRRLEAELSKEREWKSSLREIRGGQNPTTGYKRVWGESPNENALPGYYPPIPSAPAPNPPKP
jgi:hypothetical protein